MTKNTRTLGLDLGSNSIGWALIEEGETGNISGIVDLGARIFNKSVGDKKPIPKNKKRREARLHRRVLQRRARRKQKMLNYLVSLDLLPKEIRDSYKPEFILNQIDNPLKQKTKTIGYQPSPYFLRTKGLDEALSPHEFGRVLLHLSARRGFLSARKYAAGDLIDDPDTVEYLQQIDQAEGKTKEEKEEGAFKQDISNVYQAMKTEGSRTLGEYLFNRGKKQKHLGQRNRWCDGGHLRTDRAMYKDELSKIWEIQEPHFAHLPEDFIEQIEKIIFYQRPLKLRKDRIGRCSLEPKNHRASMARLETQRFRYLQDINNLAYLDEHSTQWQILDSDQKQQLVQYLEKHPSISVTNLRKELKLGKNAQINLEAKNLKGNVTACDIRSVIGNYWDELSDTKQKALVEDVLSIKKKSALKNRLINHWSFDTPKAVQLCLLQFEDSYSNHSLKAINKILPFLEAGDIYSTAREKAGYDYKPDEITEVNKLPAPPETSNPIVNKGLHELKRLVNAIIKQYGKPDAIRIEMARDLEMNTKRVKDYIAQQTANQKSNENAENSYREQTGNQYASHNDKLKHRLWMEQKYSCIYSGKTIAVSQLFTNATDIDHIVPRSLCLDNSFINKVVCFVSENRQKGQRSPVEAWGNDEQKWHEITKRLDDCYPDIHGKKYRKDKTHPKKRQFFMRQEDIGQKYGMSAAQLNDTRYISKLAQGYLQQLGADVSVTKGAIVAEIRRLWGFNTLLGSTDKKERNDHRHHCIDAVVIACTNRFLHNSMVQAIKVVEQQGGKISLSPPYDAFRKEVEKKLKAVLISHVPKRKLSGALHEKTGSNYIAKHGSLVSRNSMADLIKKKKWDIVDQATKDAVLAHVDQYESVKEAFANTETVYQKDGKTPIKRVRVLVSKKIKKTKLAESKFGIKDKSGKIFKYMAYGNMHHVEIIQNIKTEAIKAEFVTMMLASHRARGIDMPKQPMIKIDHGSDWKFLMALHINDTVSIENDKHERIFYRVQKLDRDDNRFLLRLATAADIQNKEQARRITVNKANFDLHKIQFHKINAIGQLCSNV